MRPIRREALVYVMLWKPKGISTNADPVDHGDDLVGHPTGRVVPSRPSRRRLHRVPLTNDGELAHRLAHPRFEVHKTYEVVLDGDLDDSAQLERTAPGRPRSPRPTQSN